MKTVLSRWASQPRSSPLLLGILLTATVSLGEGIVDTCSTTAFEAAFDQALAGGGLIQLRCDQTNQLTATKVITIDTTIEDETANGWLAGDGSHRLFNVASNVTLTLINVRLTNGRAEGEAGAEGTTSSDGESGNDGLGGAIHLEGGHLQASGVTFHSHQALGGNGGDGDNAENLGELPSQGGNGGSAYGGAIYGVHASIALTNCVFELNSAIGGTGGSGGSSEGLLRDGGDGGDGGLAQGGAVYLSGDSEVLLVSCEFRSNEALGAEGGLGGLGDGFVHFDGANGASTAAYGGALAVVDGSATLLGCRFDENLVVGADGLPGPFQAVDPEQAAGDPGRPGCGGAIFLTNASLSLRESGFFDNRAEGGLGGDGGARATSGDGGNGGSGGLAQGASLFAEGESTLHLQDSTFTRNVALAGFGGFGALGQNEFSFNGEDGTAGNGEGGAVHLVGGQLALERCTFDANGATGAEGLEGASGNAFLSGSSGNPGGAGLGGAILIQSGLLTVTNSTFHANYAEGGNGGKGGDGSTGLAFATDGGDGARGGSASGGAIWCHSEQIALVVHSTFSTNRVIGGQGGQGGLAGDPDLSDAGSDGSTGTEQGAQLATASSGIELDRSLLAYGGEGLNAAGSIVDKGWNISSDSTPAFLPIGTSLNNTDPLLARPADNGGATRTIALTDGSYAIDRVDAPAIPDIDQRGWLRDAKPDSGAFEVGAANLPSLTIQLDFGNATISWSASGPTAQLESSRSLLAPEWTLTSGAVETNGNWTITITTTDAERYFRLRR